MNRITSKSVSSQFINFSRFIENFNPPKIKEVENQDVKISNVYDAFILRAGPSALQDAKLSYASEHARHSQKLKYSPEQYSIDNLFCLS